MPCQTRSQTKSQANYHRKTRGQSEARYQTRSQTRYQNGIQSRYRTGRLAKRQTSHRTRCDGRREAKPPLTFSQLPPEIRFMIWEEFVRTPRIIHVDLHAEDPGAYPGYTVNIYGSNGIWHRYRNCKQVCPLLGVNQESRRVAMKEPLNVFCLTIPVTTRKRFRQDHSITYFAVRPHDFLFFKGSDSWRFEHIHNAFQPSNVANVIIDVDVGSINCRPYDALKNWMDLLLTARTITGKLQNREYLKNFYCLMQDQTIDKERQFELDDLCELTPRRFPKHKQNLTIWLEAFGKLPERIREPHLEYQLNENLRLIKGWKNVTVG